MGLASLPVTPLPELLPPNKQAQQASPCAKLAGYSWQKLQETIRRESQVHGLIEEENEDCESESGSLDDTDDDAETQADLENGREDESHDDEQSSRPGTFSMLISAVLCK